MNALQTTLRFRDALEVNVHKIATHYKEHYKDWYNYILEYVEKNHGLQVPLEHYRLMYNKSVEILKEIN